MTAAYRTLPRSAVPGAAAASQIVVRMGSALGAAVLAVVLQTLTRADGVGPRAFTGSLLWSFGIGVLALVPALLIPRRFGSGQVISPPR
ncbi:hypothetical protein ACQPYK_40245 [Streptosporangium sp. CA-135522]|uniref:hypothetical protein n=1 Tax=Streptosporangium sp. CA-135522 TaxID=3240072 RepID=UPI003D926F48